VHAWPRGAHQRQPRRERSLRAGWLPDEVGVEELNELLIQEAVQRRREPLSPHKLGAAHAVPSRETSCVSLAELSRCPL
jgi:hypothetical protein